MRKALILALSILAVLVVVSAAPSAYAEGNPWVRLTKTDSTETDTFLVGEDVVIEAYHSKDYTIKVYDPNNNLLWSATSSAGKYGPTTVSGITPFVADDYYIQIEDTIKTYDVGGYFVIPEVPLGVAAVLTACFVGLGINRLRRKRQF